VSPWPIIVFFLLFIHKLLTGFVNVDNQVMKMYMPLIASEDGVPMFVKQPGVSLEPGDILGVLTLDDPTRVKHAKPFEGLLPTLGLPNVIGNKPHQRLQLCIEVFHNILDGYDNQAIMAATLKDLLTVLNDPELPYAEAAAILSSLSGRLPPKLDESIRAAIDQSKAKSQEFPSAKIKKYIDNHINENVRAQDRTMFRSQLTALEDVVERYRNGLKMHEWGTIIALLTRYEATEKLFGGRFEERVLGLREQNKENLDVVAQLVLSHSKAQSKNKLVMALLELVQSTGQSISTADNASEGVNSALRALAALESR